MVFDFRLRRIVAVVLALCLTAEALSMAASASPIHQHQSTFSAAAHDGAIASQGSDHQHFGNGETQDESASMACCGSMSCHLFQIGVAQSLAELDCHFIPAALLSDPQVRATAVFLLERPPRAR